MITGAMSGAACYTYMTINPKTILITKAPILIFSFSCFRVQSWGLGLQGEATQLSSRFLPGPAAATWAAMFVLDVPGE